MYYKAQMGGREKREREGEESSLAGRQAGRPTQLAESVPLFASEGTQYIAQQQHK